MLPKEQKLTRVTFPKYTEPKKTWTGVSLRVQYFYTREAETTRYAVVVSKKVHALAVNRNRLKRLVFGALEANGGSLLQRTGMKVVIYPLKSENPQSAGLIEKDIADFVAQLR